MKSMPVPSQPVADEWPVWAQETHAETEMLPIQIADKKTKEDYYHRALKVLKYLPGWEDIIMEDYRKIFKQEEDYGQNKIDDDTRVFVRKLPDIEVKQELNSNWPPLDEYSIIGPLAKIRIRYSGTEESLWRSLSGRGYDNFMLREIIPQPSGFTVTVVMPVLQKFYNDYQQLLEGSRPRNTSISRFILAQPNQAVLIALRAIVRDTFEIPEETLEKWQRGLGEQENLVFSILTNHFGALRQKDGPFNQGTVVMGAYRELAAFMSQKKSENIKQCERIWGTIRYTTNKIKSSEEFIRILYDGRDRIFKLAGAKPSRGDTVCVAFDGYTRDNEKSDGKGERFIQKEDFVFKVGGKDGIIPDFEKVIREMSTGEARTFTIKANNAYEGGFPRIIPNEDTVFDVRIKWIDYKKVRSYLIVGAGVFGASTAMHLAKSEPCASITLISPDFPSVSAAGYDISKIVRTEDQDEFRMKIQLEAMKAWEDNSEFREFYHEVGVAFVGAAGPALQVKENYHKIGENPPELFGVDEMKEKVGQWYDKLDWTDVETCSFNPRGGWVEADNALKRGIDVAEELGVELISATVSRPLYRENGSCYGVEATIGSTSELKEYHADKVILCAGVGITRLVPELKDKINVTEALMATFDVPYSCLKDAPILVRPVGIYPGESTLKSELFRMLGPNLTAGETIPSVGRGCVKVTCHLGDRAESCKLKQPLGDCDWTKDIPEDLKHRVNMVGKSIYGDSLENATYRLCQDVNTKDGDFIICEHPGHPNMIVATGGSFYAAKLFLIIGDSVVKVTRGESLPDDALERWGWNRGGKGTLHSAYAAS
ncbi:hypothetical protein FQN57_004926 [Myotisia sp. PD_48]|nr:hypothetical protein FQN57_004926 [Myotisia sp. PD_48]